MLTHLVIRNFAIIESLEIPFCEGFTVVTGETGAGKSIVIDALNLLLGGRATAEIIRTETDEAQVEGVFEPKPRLLERVNERLIEVGISPGDQLVIRRTISRSGRNKVFINGSLTTVGTLASVCVGLVDISGQHEHYSLLHPEGHVDILDEFAELGPVRRRVAEAAQLAAALAAELADLERGVRERAGRIDYLRFQLAEIDDARLRPGEDEAIAEELSRLKYAERLSEGAARAVSAVYERQGSAAQVLGDAAAQLGKLAEYDPAYEEFSERMAEAKIVAEECARDLRSHAARIEPDPRRLDALIERSEELKRLERKHGESIEEVLACADRMRRELAELEGAEERGQQLAERYEAAAAKAFKLAARLSKARRAAAKLLERCVESELGDLNMARTRFVVHFGPESLPDESGSLRVGPRGFDEVEFLISPNPGEEPKPLAKIASGGELSRVMLVMKSALLDRDLVGTYVFDEVDTGIGGATADRVGQKIGRAAREHQVLCITHLAQIASIADHHYSVEKSVVGKRTQSTIRPLSEPERVAEIARMLGGARVTDTTIEAARELISARARP